MLYLFCITLLWLAAALLVLGFVALCREKGVFAGGIRHFRRMPPVRRFAWLALVGLSVWYGGAKDGTQSGGSTPPRSSPPNPAPIDVATNGAALAISSFAVDGGGMAVGFGVTWASNLFDLAASRSLDLFMSTNLQSRRWWRLGGFEMPQGATSHVFSVSADDVDAGALEAFTNSFGCMAFFRFGAAFDSDGDGLTDAYETLVSLTDPSAADTDGDGLSDGDEMAIGSSPLLADTDGDGVSDRTESVFGTDPCSADTDGDGLSDAEEAGNVVIQRDVGGVWYDMVSFSAENVETYTNSAQIAARHVLSSPVRQYGRYYRSVSVDHNGVVVLHSETNGPLVRLGWICRDVVSGFFDDSCMTVAPFWAPLEFSAQSVVRVYEVSPGDGYLCVEYERMQLAGFPHTEDYELTFQVWVGHNLPTSQFRTGTVVNFGAVGQGVTGATASIGLRAANGRIRLKHAYGEAGSVQTDMSIEFPHGATGTSPVRADTDGDGLSDGAERSLNLDPLQPDTDGDGMNDGWEQVHSGFDPAVDNATDGNLDNDIGADLDGDGLTNGQECELGTNPGSADTDGDGVGDGAEVAQNSDPNDASDVGAPNSRVPVPFRFGDPSGSHSEKYRLTVTPTAGPGDEPSPFSWLNENYGQCETKTAMLKAGWTYEVRLYHAGTNMSGSPDYDYELNCGGGSPPPSNVAVDDPSSLFGVDDTSTSFAGEGKVAWVHVLAPPQIAAPSVVGVNNDDDDGDGTADFMEDGEVADDDDLAEVTVSASCPDGKTGTITVTPVVDVNAVRVWRDAERTDQVDASDSFAVSGVDGASRTYYVEGDRNSASYLSERIRVSFSCSGATSTNEHRFTVVERIAEPIITERSGGQVVNPCCAVLGGSAPMRVKVLPQNFPDEMIKWRVVSGAGSFGGGDTGRDVAFAASGAEGSAAILRVDVGDCPGRAPQFTLRATSMHEVTIYPCAVVVGGEPLPVSQAQLNAMIGEVNVIYRQVGMHFSLGAPLMCVTNDVWAVDGLTYAAAGSHIRNIMSGTGGLEVYFISGSGDEDEPVGAWNAYGIIVKASANAKTLAHEIGHACGWHDIYFKNGNSIIAELRERPKQSWMPLDWSNGTGCRFYDSFLSQYQVIQRLLMLGTESDMKCDIPSGGVYGRTKDGTLGNVSIGSSDFMTTSPLSL